MQYNTKKHLDRLLANARILANEKTPLQQVYDILEDAKAKRLSYRKKTWFKRKYYYYSGYAMAVRSVLIILEPILNEYKEMKGQKNA